MATTRIAIDTDTSVIEAVVGSWLNGVGSSLGCVVLHPWGRLGGSMDDPTVVANYEAALKSGLFSVVARYNQRGVGQSRAKASAPDADAADLVAVCDYLLRAPPPGGGAPPPRRIVLIAYSYGSVVAANALAQLGPAAAAYVSIGFPLGRMARALLGSGAAWRALAAAQLPKLVIAGTRDEFTSPAQLRAAVAEHDAAVLAAAASASASAGAGAGSAAAAAAGGSDGGGGPSTPAAAASAARGGPYLVQCELVDGADHFFHLLQDGVAAQVQAWLARHLAGSDEPGRAAAVDLNVEQ